MEFIIGYLLVFFGICIGWFTSILLVSNKVSRLEELEYIVDKILALHKETQGPYDNLVCDWCSLMDIDIDYHTDYPCKTVKIIEESNGKNK